MCKHVHCQNSSQVGRITALEPEAEPNFIWNPTSSVDKKILVRRLNSLNHSHIYSSFQVLGLKLYSHSQIQQQKARKQRDRLIYFSQVLFKSFKIKCKGTLIFLFAYFYTVDVEINTELNTATFWKRATPALNLKLVSCHELCVSKKSGPTALHPKYYSVHINFHFTDFQYK